jgi:hypothetical protein
MIGVLLGVRARRGCLAWRHSPATNQDILDSRACNCDRREIAEGIAPVLTFPKAQKSLECPEPQLGSS